MLTQRGLFGWTMSALLALCSSCERGGAFDPLSQTDGSCTISPTPAAIPPCGPDGTEKRCYVNPVNLTFAPMGNCDYSADGIMWANPTPTSLQFGSDSSKVGACGSPSMVSKKCAVKLTPNIPMQNAKHITMRFGRKGVFYNEFKMGTAEMVGVNSRGSINIGGLNVFNDVTNIANPQTITVGGDVNGNNDIVFSVSDECYFTGFPFPIYWHIENMTIEVER